MALPIQSLVRRHLKSTEGFTDGRGSPLPWRIDVENEHVVGWYRDSGQVDGASLLFTDSAIYVGGPESWRRVAITSIIGYDLLGAKGAATGVTVTTSEGAVAIPISGKSGPGGKYDDAFALLGLLRVVTLANCRDGRG